ncbi:MAG TPA: LytR C-terminal domain-containing protein [Actinomycetota bacterium]|jgi:hypothetical protein
MKTGAGRLIVIVAAVVVGILVLAKGLQGSAAVVGSGATTSPHSGTSPSPSATGSTHTPNGNGNGNGGNGNNGGGGKPTPRQSGVMIALYNATNTDGLAGATATRLQAKGYVLAGQPGNWPPSTTTIIYYKDDQGKIDAQHLKELAIPEAQIKPLPKNLPSEAQIPPNAELIVGLGSDYAQSHPVNG